MQGAFADEQRRLAGARIDTWLWLRLRSEGFQLHLDSFGAKDVQQYLVNLASGGRARELLENVSKHCIIPNDQLKWITDDTRQISWLLSYAAKIFPVNLAPIPRILIGKNLLLATIDLFDIDYGLKLSAIDRMRSDWNEHLKSDIIFKWFKGKEEVVRCSFAWEWLVSHKARETYGQDAITTQVELLWFYDRINVNDAQKKLDVVSIKKKWSQQKYRAGLKDKSQYNFVLSNQAIADLDKMAKKYEATRPQIIEALIKMEAAQGAYLPQKVKKTPWN